MSIGLIVTRGFGNGALVGNITNVVTRGYAIGVVAVARTRFVKLTVNNAEVPGDLTNFPAVITRNQLDYRVVDPSGATRAQVDAGDIVFATDTEMTNRLACEIVSFGYDSVSGAGDASIEIHVNIPNVSGTIDTDIYMHWGSASVESQPATSAAYGRDAVWDADFVGVWHMQEDPSGGGSPMIDATGNGHDGATNGAMTSGDSVAGKFGGNALDLDGVNDNVQIPDHVDLDGMAELTIESWSKLDVGGNYPMMVVKGAWSQDVYQQYYEGTTLLTGGLTKSGIFDSPVTAVAGFTPQPGDWVKSDLVMTTSFLVCFADDQGGLPASVFTSIPTNALDLFFGSSSDGLGYLDGSLDEIRISKTARSQDWRTASYNNQNSPDTFWSVTTLRLVNIDFTSEDRCITLNSNDRSVELTATERTLTLD